MAPAQPSHSDCQPTPTSLRESRRAAHRPWGIKTKTPLALWSADGQTEPRLLKPFSSLVRVVAWSASGNRILVGARGWGQPSALVWNGDGQGFADSALWSGPEILSAALSADGKTAVTIGSQGSAWRWNLDHVENLRTSVLQKQLWTMVRSCPSDPELEATLNRSLASLDGTIGAANGCWSVCTVHRQSPGPPPRPTTNASGGTRKNASPGPSGRKPRGAGRAWASR